MPGVLSLYGIILYMATLIGLKQLCKQHGIKSPPGITKEQMCAMLIDAGVDPEAKAEVRKKKSIDSIKSLDSEPSSILVKMERSNSTFTFSGNRFTSDQPYCLIKEDVAIRLFESYDGFRVASVQEVMEFYSE